MNYDEDDWLTRAVREEFRRVRENRNIAIEMRCCARCGGEAEVFADELSARDYGITGLCQTCQDKVYAESEECYADTGERP